MGEALVREEEPACGEGRGEQAERGDRADSPSTTPQLRVEGFEGPLDFLLEMVRRQRVDLGPLSILTLTDQLVSAIENSAGSARLERRADWLVMASQLLLLKAQLLAPASQEAAEEAQEEARRRLEQLDELARMRAGAEWLAARAQLGREVFARGQVDPPAPRPQAELYVAFLEATLALLESREGQGAEAPTTYRPAPPDLWRISDAVRRITELLGQSPAGLPLQRCLPTIPPAAPDRPLRLRAALASTLVAGLELARDGRVLLRQDEAFDAVLIGPVPA
ncbi:segregation/condensation protein A [Roseomonas nepalensis]|uniref:Segregation and condensation protein A n=1 Tax=Muricoccus nepalensis TaxID=1854500 RepID=A0A502EMF2_9PROT|nr:segregation/condensation protein A [Roseomonas nepalensis]TPG38234.1 segregation/condensation protein A [Roseomonas nepalensis]